MSILKRAFDFQCRESESGKISGYVFQFSEVATYAGRKEKFSENLEFKISDHGAYLLRDHNPERCLGKAGENLMFEKDNTGLLFRATALSTDLWKETMELIRKKVLSKMSIGFSVLKESETEDMVTYDRIVVWETSVVLWPSYSSSSVEARNKKETKLLPPELL